MGLCEDNIPYLWKAGSPVRLPVPENEFRASADGIDDLDTIVGEGIAQNDASYSALLWRDGQVFNLNSLVDSAVTKKWTLVSANSINDVGQISGLARAVDGSSTQPYRLTPMK